jgi:hypothetical protein
MSELYLKVPLQKSLSSEEKAEFVKRNKQHLIMPVDGEISDEWIDKMVYNIKTNWKNGGAEAHEQLTNMYVALKKAGYE